MKHFTELLVWQKAHRLFLDLAKDVASLPKTPVNRILTDQILRSSSSISDNISEGFSSLSTREYIHYLGISRKSGSETENHLYQFRDLSLMPVSVVEERLRQIIEVNRMLMGLIKSLRKGTK
ncbi:MAG TPA: four helix bundle protein [candidate division Zixibacteria bacterium]|nr:four helix bundle protein [candidate division Zixibacteria bacterium]